MLYLESLVMIFCMGSIFFYGYACYAARLFFSKTAYVPKPINPDFFPPITLLKPLCGLDADAYENFASFCRQDYPQFQIIFGVKDPTDPVIDIVNQIMADYPNCDISLVISGQFQNQAQNPKMMSLLSMASQAKYPFLLISDADIFVHADYLKQMAPFMSDETIGIVTGGYRSRGSNFVNLLEQIETATEYLPGIIAGAKLQGLAWTIGCSVLIRRTALDALGGFDRLKDSLGEDCRLGKLMVAQGYKIVLSPYLVEHRLNPEHFLNFLRRKIRWNKGIFSCYPFAYLACIFTYGGLMSALLLCMTAFSMGACSLFFLMWSLRFFLAWYVGAKHLGDLSLKSLFFLVPLYDLIGFFLWIFSLLQNKVYWRGHYFKIKKNGQLLSL